MVEEKRGERGAASTVAVAVFEQTVLSDAYSASFMRADTQTTSDRQRRERKRENERVREIEKDRGREVEKEERDRCIWRIYLYSDAYKLR